MRIVETEAEFLDQPVARIVDVELSERPVVALLYGMSAALIDLLGPIFWAALIVLLVESELFAN